MTTINSPLDSIDAYGQLSTGLDFDNLLTQYIDKGLIHGYSVARKLVNISSNLQAFRVRRSSDNAEQDIGFIGDDVDTSSLLSFVGANDGFVVTIYDQIGTNDATQSTAGFQHRIVNSGTLETRNNKPVQLKISGINSQFYSFGSTIDLTNASKFAVIARVNVTATSLLITTNTTSSTTYFIRPNSGQQNYRLNNINSTINDTVLIQNQLYSLSIINNAVSTNVIAYKDNINIGQTTLTQSTGTYNGIFTSNTGQAVYAELLIFDRVLSEADRYSINKNINDFYGI